MTLLEGDGMACDPYPCWSSFMCIPALIIYLLEVRTFMWFGNICNPVSPRNFFRESCSSEEYTRLFILSLNNVRVIFRMNLHFPSNKVYQLEVWVMGETISRGVLVENLFPLQGRGIIRPLVRLLLVSATADVQ